VIDLPPPASVVVTEQQLLTRYGPVCQRWWTPTPDWTGHVLLSKTRTQGTQPKAQKQSTTPRKRVSWRMSVVQCTHVQTPPP